MTVIYGRLHLHGVGSASAPRKTPVHTNYRTVFRFHGGELHDGVVLLSSQTRQLLPGASATVIVQPLLEAPWQVLRVGDMLIVQEGSRVVGTFDVLGIYIA